MKRITWVTTVGLTNNRIATTVPSICGVRRPSNAQSLVGSLNYLGFGEGLPFEGLMSSNVIQLAAPAGTTTVSPSTVIRQLASRSCSGTTFNFKRAVRLNWLNQSSLHNGDWKNAVSPHFCTNAQAKLVVIRHGESVLRRIG